MRKKIIAANWKMNKTRQQAHDLLNEILEGLEQKDQPYVMILAVPFPFLPDVSERTRKKNFLFTAAQNCHWADAGAYTGEVSVPMIKSCGARYILCGHSERRNLFHEDEAIIAKKIDRILHHDITPVFCCGEQTEDRKQNAHFQVVERQISGSLFHLNEEDLKRSIIAYEPVWAIGSGLTASPEQAQEMHAHIRQFIAGHKGGHIAEHLPILYGGSVNPTNASELFKMPDIDGGLIGGASLNAADFLDIARAL